MTLISRELQSLIGTNSSTGKIQGNVIKNYFKRRALSIVFSVIVLMILVTTSLFTDFGLNIGQAILDFLGF